MTLNVVHFPSLGGEGDSIDVKKADGRIVPNKVIWIPESPDGFVGYLPAVFREDGVRWGTAWTVGEIKQLRDRSSPPYLDSGNVIIARDWDSETDTPAVGGDFN